MTWKQRFNDAARALEDAYDTTEGARLAGVPDPEGLRDALLEAFADDPSGEKAGLVSSGITLGWYLRGQEGDD